MATASLHSRQTASQPPHITNPLPQLLQTPAGLALLELQGTINLPAAAERDGSAEESSQTDPVAIGRLDFPDYSTTAADTDATAWMRRVYLYVGMHQRLTGEVKKLPKPLAVVRRRSAAEGDGRGSGTAMDVDEAAAKDGDGGDHTEALEVVEIVKYKIVFSQRPEPVGTAVEG